MLVLPDLREVLDLMELRRLEVLLAPVLIISTGLGEGGAWKVCLDSPPGDSPSVLGLCPDWLWPLDWLLVDEDDLMKNGCGAKTSVFP